MKVSYFIHSWGYRFMKSSASGMRRDLSKFVVLYAQEAEKADSKMSSINDLLRQPQ